MFASLAALADAKAADLYNNTNTASVDNNPTGKSGFTLTGAAQISELATYHWNSGQGSAPGFIGLQVDAPNGKSYGSFQAHGTPSGAHNNVNWVADVNVTLPPGNYIVTDSDPATWSQNAQSGHRGFAIVRGTYSPTPPAEAYDTDCTAGCVTWAQGGLGIVNKTTFTCSAKGPHATCGRGEQGLRCTDGIHTTICRCSGPNAKRGCFTH